MPRKQALRPCKLVSWCFKGELGPRRWAARGQSQCGVPGDVGTTGTLDLLLQTRVQSRAKALLLETVPAPTKADGVSPAGICQAWGPAGGGRAFLAPGSRAAAPAARDAGELLPTPHPCSPLPPALAVRLCLRRCLYSQQLMKIFIILLAAAVEEVQICISTANHAVQTEPVTQQR